MNIRTCNLVAGLIAILASGIAAAVPLTFTFSATVSAIISDDSSGTFSANFAVGDAVTGEWTVDTSATENVLSPTIHYYDATFSATISGKTFSGPVQYRHFNDDPSAGDGYSIINESGTYSGPALGPLVPGTFFFQVVDMPTSTLTDFSLITDPEALFPLANLSFAPHGFRLDNPDGSFGGLYFTLNQVTTVPEPGALALLALGLAGLRLARRTGISAA